MSVEASHSHRKWKNDFRVSEVMLEDVFCADAQGIALEQG